jgi:hypothetical protein
MTALAARELGHFGQKCATPKNEKTIDSGLPLSVLTTYLRTDFLVRVNGYFAMFITCEGAGDNTPNKSGAMACSASLKPHDHTTNQRNLSG